MFLFDLTWGPIPVCRMQIQCKYLVLYKSTHAATAGSAKSTRPLPEPAGFFFQHLHEPFDVCVPVRIVVNREGLGGLERRARLHECYRRGLTPIVAHQ